MEKRCQRICSCLSDSKDPEDVKRQAYRVVECSFYTKKTAPSFLNHCFHNNACQNEETQKKDWKTRCENECENTMPEGKMKVRRRCHASFPIPSYKTFECDAEGDACQVRNDAGQIVGAAPTKNTPTTMTTTTTTTPTPMTTTKDGKGIKEVPKVVLSEDVDKMMTLRGLSACVTKEASGNFAIKCPIRKVLNCEGKCEDEMAIPQDSLRCKELCPDEVVPLKKRQIYARCGGMIPGYGGHVPGYSICTLGNNYSLETDRCLKRVISAERLDAIVRRCKLDDTKIIFIVGGPGSGKGTQCDMLKTRFNLTHLSSGDLLRAEVESGSALGKSLLLTMERGELVSLETVLDILEAKMMEALKKGTKGFLIDGYPREIEQGLTFARKIRDCDVVLFFDAKDETMTQRLLKRAETSGRADDNYATIRLRLQTFHSQTQPVVDYYKNRGKLIHVNAERHPKVVFQEVEQKLLQAGF